MVQSIACFLFPQAVRVRNGLSYAPDPVCNPTKIHLSIPHRNVDIRHQLCSLPTPRFLEGLYDAWISPVGDVRCDDVSQDADVQHYILVGIMNNFAKVEDWHEGKRALDTRERVGTGWKRLVSRSINSPLFFLAFFLIPFSYHREC